MKKLFIFLVLISTIQLNAQTTKNSFVILSESRVKDNNVAFANLSRMNASAVKLSNGTITSRGSNFSESGRIYTLTNVPDLGKFINERGDFWTKALAENQDIVEQDNNNITQPSQRSTWERLSELSNLPANYKSTDYTFRRIDIFTVANGKNKEYQALQSKWNELNKKNGIDQRIIILKAMEGYTTNTYLFIQPDKSAVDYYIHRNERSEMRKKDPEFKKVWDALNAIRTNIRIDHLNSVL
jgi:hypothetical protein